MTDSNIIKALKLIIPVLNSTGIDYWLGRGVLRNMYITGKVGDQNSDLDFHIWKEDADLVKSNLHPLLTSLYSKLKVDDKDYKLAYYTPAHNNRHDFFVEFIYLFKDENHSSYIYHCRNNGRRYTKASCFESERKIFLENNGQLIRVPALIHEYLLGTYGLEWYKNHKQSKKFKSTPELLSEYEKQKTN